MTPLLTIAQDRKPARQHAKKTVAARVNEVILHRFKTLVQHSELETMESALEQAMLGWIDRHPLKEKKLRKVSSLPSGPRSRSQRAPRDLFVVLEDDFQSDLEETG